MSRHEKQIRKSGVNPTCNFSSTAPSIRKQAHHKKIPDCCRDCHSRFDHKRIFMVKLFLRNSWTIGIKKQLICHCSNWTPPQFIMMRLTQWLWMMNTLLLYSSISVVHTTSQPWCIILKLPIAVYGYPELFFSSINELSIWLCQDILRASINKLIMLCVASKSKKG